MCLNHEKRENQKSKEMTVGSIVLGVLLAGVFAATNTYLGLKIGRGISVNIPAVIFSMYFFKFIKKRRGILETGITQSMAAIGEGVSCGLIFPLPAILLLGMELPMKTILVVGVIGGVAGVLFAVPFRKYLVEKEDGKLLFPESKAIAEVIISTERDKDGFYTIIKGLIAGGVYKLCTDFLKLWKSTISYQFQSIRNAGISFNIMSSLVGIGFIIGPKISMLMTGGAIFSSLFLIPLVSYFQELFQVNMSESLILLNPDEVRKIYVQYITVGTVAAGGLISVLETVPMLIEAGKNMLGVRNGSLLQKRDRRDMNVIFPSIVIILIITWMFYQMNAGIPMGIMTVVCAFLLCMVSGRIIGMIGNGNSPMSGMTIVSVLVLTVILKISGYAKNDSAMYALSLGAAIVCVAIGVASNVAQNLKVTFIIGGDSRKTERAMLLSIFSAALTSGAVILLLANRFGVGSEQVPAPQAYMIATMIKGMITGDLPWNLILIGVFLAFALWLLRLPVLSVAIGMYLPSEISTTIFLGALIRWGIDYIYRNRSDLDSKIQKGTLLASGLIAGEAIIGILVAILEVFGIDINFGKNFSSIYHQIMPVMGASMLLIWFYSSIVKKVKN